MSTLNHLNGIRVCWLMSFPIKQYGGYYSLPLLLFTQHSSILSLLSEIITDNKARLCSGYQGAISALAHAVCLVHYATHVLSSVDEKQDSRCTKPLGRRPDFSTLTRKIFLTIRWSLLLGLWRGQASMATTKQ